MKVRDKKSPDVIWFSDKFNIHAVCPVEIIIQNIDLGADSAYMRDFEVYLESQKKWVDMSQAFKDHSLINDSYNTYFFEPKTEEDKIRGYTLN